MQTLTLIPLTVIFIGEVKDIMEIRRKKKLYGVDDLKGEDIKIDDA